MPEFRPLGLRELFGFAWVLYRKRFGTLMAVSFFLVGLPSLVTWIPSGIGLVLLLLLMVPPLLAAAAFVRIISSECAGLEATGLDSVRTAARSLGRLLRATILDALAIGAVGLVMTIIGSIILTIFASGVIEDINRLVDDPLSATFGDTWPFMLWILVMWLPALALAMMWWLYPAAIMVEGQGAANSLRRSWHLMLLHPGRAIGVALLTLVPMVVVMGIASAFFSEVLAGFIVSVLGTPFVWVVSTVVYLDLRVRLEGLSPEVLAEELIDRPLM